MAADFAVPGSRPGSVGLLAALLLASAVFMALLGWSASAYYVPAICLLLQAALLWSGRGLGPFRWILIANQASGLLLILVLWFGNGLGHAKLDIAGASLLINLLCGGPLTALLAVAILPGLRRGRRLGNWFRLRAA